jgi:hypothetical protein
VARCSLTHRPAVHRVHHAARHQCDHGSHRAVQRKRSLLRGTFRARRQRLRKCALRADRSARGRVVRRKSRSVEHSTAPYSSARAARATSVTSGPLTCSQTKVRLVAILALNQ